MDVAFWQRASTILSHNQVPFSGAILRTDTNLNITQRLEFSQAVFSEAFVGALDASESKRETPSNFELDVHTLGPPARQRQGSYRTRLQVEKIP